MTVLKRTQVIAKPIEDVFRVIVDGERWAEWNPTVLSSRALDGQPEGNGARFEWDLRGVGKVVQELQEFDRPRQVRIVPHMKQTEGGHRFRLTSQGDSTRIDHELEIRGRGAFVLMAPMLGMVGRKNLRDTANALQAHLDSRGGDS